jgi:predicted TIM-barrel fold metal-dependent hydrolase
MVGAGILGAGAAPAVAQQVKYSSGAERPKLTAIARAYVKAAPERLVWGSDWPHPGVRDPEPKPDDAILFDLMLD